jgi:hypothetical protein
MFNAYLGAAQYLSFIQDFNSCRSTKYRSGNGYVHGREKELLPPSFHSDSRVSFLLFSSQISLLQLEMRADPHPTDSKNPC